MRFAGESRQCKVRQRRGSKMRLADRYWNYAAECVRLAQEVKNPHDKAMHLQMAETWRHLAEQAARKDEVDDS